MKFKTCGVFNVSYQQELSLFRQKSHRVAFAFSIVLFIVLPFIVPLNVLDFFIRTFIVLIILLGLEIVMGYCGQISLGHAAFACVGAFTGAILLRIGVPYLLALLSAGISAGLIGLIFALPAIRVKGLYLAFSTLAAHFIIIFLITHYAGGGSGYEVRPPTLFGIQFNSFDKQHTEKNAFDRS